MCALLVSAASISAASCHSGNGSGNPRRRFVTRCWSKGKIGVSREIRALTRRKRQSRNNRAVLLAGKRFDRGRVSAFGCSNADVLKTAPKAM